MILMNTDFIGLNCKTAFARSSGTPPYTYSVLPDGAGGTITSGGIYTAPISEGVGFDIVSISDSLGSVLKARISVYGPLKLFAEVIRRGLGLGMDQVYLYNQKFNIPTDQRMYVAIGVLSQKSFSNQPKMESVEDGLMEIQSTNVHSVLSINILSRSTEALERKEEVVLALNSVYAQSQQETNSFYIGKIPSNFVNLSELEGSAIPYRFNISVPIQYSVKKSRLVNFYDTFEVSQINGNN